MTKSPHGKLQTLDLQDVSWTTGFWADRARVLRENLIPTMARLMSESDRARFVGNFEVAAGLVEGRHRGPKWNDGDFYKWVEAGCIVLATHPDAALSAQLDELIALIAKAQQADGYIHTDITIRQKAGEDVKRFGNPMDFEMYNMGHLMLAGIAHHRATGRTSLLDVAIKSADFLCRQFESPTAEQARHGICPVHLTGLIELFRYTGEARYRDLAVTLLNMRDLVTRGDDDNQDRVPFRQQTEAVGHAVRATYLYTGAGDIYLETGDPSLLPPLKTIWNDLVTRKLYVTGGCGALFDGASPDGVEQQATITRVHQAFGRAFQLPNSTAHNETCAAIGSVLWNWRMLLITGESRFADLLEHTLLNSVLAGVSLDGTAFFYTNSLRQLHEMPAPLRWNRHRKHHINCFCCPPNVARTLAQANQYAYAKDDVNIYAIVYGSNTLDTSIAGGRVRLRQETDYPWNGSIRITIDHSPEHPFSLHLRIPAWAGAATVRVNGAEERSQRPRPGSFYRITRQLKTDDVIELDLPMPARLMEANPLVEEARNHIAVARGPVVYCLESLDLPSDVRLLDVQLTPDASFTPAPRDKRLPGIEVLKGEALAARAKRWSEQLYRELSDEDPEPIDVRLIPYFAWDNRGEHEMTVWIPLTR